MSQVSPDGQYAVSTFSGSNLEFAKTYYVRNFTDYRFLQVFYPTKGILEWYSRATGQRQPLPGADDPRYVQTNGVWSHDGKYIVFARALAREPRDPAKPEQTTPTTPTKRRFNTIFIASRSTTEKVARPSASWEPQKTA